MISGAKQFLEEEGFLGENWVYICLFSLGRCQLVGGHTCEGEDLALGFEIILEYLMLLVVCCWWVDLR